MAEDQEDRRSRWADRLAKVLLILGLLLYLAAKLDFFASYGRPDYIREHSRYWIAMLVIAGLLFVLDRVWPGEDGRKGSRS